MNQLINYHLQKTIEEWKDYLGKGNGDKNDNLFLEVTLGDNSELKGKVNGIIKSIEKAIGYGNAEYYKWLIKEWNGGLDKYNVDKDYDSSLFTLIIYFQLIYPEKTEDKMDMVFFKELNSSIIIEEYFADLDGLSNLPLEVELEIGKIVENIGIERKKQDSRIIQKNIENLLVKVKKEWEGYLVLQDDKERQLNNPFLFLTWKDNSKDKIDTILKSIEGVSFLTKDYEEKKSALDKFQSDTDFYVKENYQQNKKKLDSLQLEVEDSQKRLAAKYERLIKEWNGSLYSYKVKNDYDSNLFVFWKYYKEYIYVLECERASKEGEKRLSNSLEQRDKEVEEAKLQLRQERERYEELLKEKEEVIDNEVNERTQSLQKEKDEVETKLKERSKELDDLEKLYSFKGFVDSVIAKLKEELDNEEYPLDFNLYFKDGEYSNYEFEISKMEKGQKEELEAFYYKMRKSILLQRQSCLSLDKLIKEIGEGKKNVSYLEEFKSEGSRENKTAYRVKEEEIKLVKRLFHKKTTNIRKIEEKIAKVGLNNDFLLDKHKNFKFDINKLNDGELVDRYSQEMICSVSLLKEERDKLEKIIQEANLIELQEFVDNCVSSFSLEKQKVYDENMEKISNLLEVEEIEEEDEE